MLYRISSMIYSCYIDILILIGDKSSGARALAHFVTNMDNSNAQGHGPHH